MELGRNWVAPTANLLGTSLYSPNELAEPSIFIMKEIIVCANMPHSITHEIIIGFEWVLVDNIELDLKCSTSICNSLFHVHRILMKGKIQRSLAAQRQN